MLALNTDVQYLNGVGPVMAKKLGRLGIETVRDLLFYYPRRWDDFSKPIPIRKTQINQDVIIKAKVLSIRSSRTRRKWMAIVEALLEDSSGQIKAIWFNQSFIPKIIKSGSEWLFLGKVGYDRQSGIKTINIVQYEKEPKLHSVYPETEGLTSRYLRKLIKPVLKEGADLIEEFLPSEIIKQENLIGLYESLKKIHCPQKTEDIEIAKKRLAFDELFLISLRSLEIKKDLSKIKSPKIKINENHLKKFVSELPFKLTNAQRRTAWEIILDLKGDRPMNRLLEGDVGSGKTIVSILASLVVAENNLQTVWLAPTEILATQHFNTAKRLFNGRNKVGLFTSSQKRADLEKDTLIIGTHALIQEGIEIPHLGLIIIDEQHRFGVKQRSFLRKKSGFMPHLLSMTATPIPRTLALTLYGDLDISVIDQMPEGRIKIITKVVKPEERMEAYNFIRKEIISGRQTFVICPLIETKDENKFNLFESDKKSVKQEFDKLSKEVFPEFKIGLLHGKLNSKEKESTMKSFLEGEIKILVSTAVIEVGIDVPNATVMLIEGSEKFGLAQLHQFRGRVGRGKHQSYCFLFSESWNDKTKQRLQAMLEHDNGLKLAEEDLKLRGPGEFLGLKQSGFPDLKMGSLSDIILVRRARESAKIVVEKNLQNFPALVKKLKDFEEISHLE